jgi:hypothetical protein
VIQGEEVEVYVNFFAVEIDDWIESVLMPPRVLVTPVI